MARRGKGWLFAVPAKDLEETAQQMRTHYALLARGAGAPAHAPFTAY